MLSYEWINALDDGDKDSQADKKDLLDKYFWDKHELFAEIFKTNLNFRIVDYDFENFPTDIALMKKTLPLENVIFGDAFKDEDKNVQSVFFGGFTRISDEYRCKEDGIEVMDLKQYGI